ncbi:hypothetical protein MMYC01_210495, partial [Madurella mycetomatis]
NGVAIPRQARQVSKPDFDAIIVGGGPAGLNALSGLARIRQNVLLIDSGEYRNAATRYIYNIFYYKTVAITNGTVTKIMPGDDAKLGADYHGSQGRPRDGAIQHPPGHARPTRELGPGHLLPLGLLGSLADVPGAMCEIVTLNSDVVAFVNRTDIPSAYLDAYNVTVDNRTIAAITRLQSIYLCFLFIILTKDLVRLVQEDSEKELAKEGVEKRDIELKARSL